MTKEVDAKSGREDVYERLDNNITKWAKNVNRKSGSLIKFAGHAITIIQRVTCKVRCAQMNTVEVYGVVFFFSLVGV